MSQQQNETDFCVGTIFHPPFLGLLDQHLASLAAAQKTYERSVHITLLFSYVKDAAHVVRAKKIIAKYDKILHIELLVAEQRFTCGGARNFLYPHMKAPWKVFFDVDVAVDAAYFTELHATLAVIDKDMPQVKAIAGGIGSWGESPIGRYEFMMDMYAYYGKAQGTGINREKYDFNRLMSAFPGHDSELRKFAHKNITYLQGFNHVIHEDIFAHGGYDDNFFGAEDREMAGNIISKGHEIILVPQCMVYHYYNFTTKDILRRKYGHGYYSAMFRKKYLRTKKYASGFLMYASYTLSVLYPPQTFRTPYGYWYYFLAYASFTAGTVMFHIQNHFHGVKIFRFNYSAYSFTRGEKHK